MSLYRARVEWSGTPVVGPGLSTFYGDSSGGGLDPAAILAFFNAIKTFIPAGGTITVPSEGDLIDEATGTLTGSWAASGGGTVSTGPSAVWASGVGCRVRWGTARVFRGRRVRGSTFIVPLATVQYDTNGTIVDATKSAIQSAANTFLAAPNQEPVVWSRPGPTWSGTASPIESATVPDKVSWLRSRRT